MRSTGCGGAAVATSVEFPPLVLGVVFVVSLGYCLAGCCSLEWRNFCKLGSRISPRVCGFRWERLLFLTLVLGFRQIHLQFCYGE